MKKFKTKKINKNIKYIILIIVLFSLFIIISLFKLNKSHSKLVNLLLNRFNNSETSVNLVTSNLDNLINTYSFKKKIDLYKDVPKLYLSN